MPYTQNTQAIDEAWHKIKSLHAAYVAEAVATFCLEHEKSRETWWKRWQRFRFFKADIPYKHTVFNA